MRLSEQTRCRLQTWLTAAALLFVATSRMPAQTAKDSQKAGRGANPLPARAL